MHLAELEGLTLEPVKGLLELTDFAVSFKSEILLSQHLFEERQLVLHLKHMSL